MRNVTLDLFLSKKTQVKRVQSSTSVKMKLS